jgi:poly-gamma-glutamate synthesis protein (capsule biosynthesis protein)
MAANSADAEIIALGDLMLGDEDASARSQLERLSSLGRQLRAKGFVFLNLETTVRGSEGCIDKEPRLITDRALLGDALEALSANVVSLANNHAFDCHASGFAAVRRVLDERRIECFGAGLDQAAAEAPLVTTAGGLRIGWLGYVAEDTCPSHVADGNGQGVNLLREESARRAVRELRETVDHVVVSLHWGIEYCNMPSPEQVAFARSLVDAGATLVLGHHAHVAQGVERHREGLIAYGLGNAITIDLKISSKIAIKQSRRTNSAVALRVALTRSGIASWQAIPYRMVGDRARLRDPYAVRAYTRAQRALERGVTEPRWRRRRFVEDVMLRPLWKLDPRVIRSLNTDHAKKFWRNLSRSLGLSTASE